VHGKEIMAIFAGLSLTKSVAQLAGRAGEGRCALRVDQRFCASLCRQARARARMEIKVEHPFEPELSLIRNPIIFSGAPVKDYRAPPLGANTREVLATIGYDDAKLDGLKKQEII
jgi:crotonobetainyl-CoA:carnitine CoA-transferase CaiB-like acyl-CoA transferase